MSDVRHGAYPKDEAEALKSLYDNQINLTTLWVPVMGAFDANLFANIGT
jgi:hypothetical protein